MLRFIQSASPEQARTYYTEGLTREDYYSQGQEIAGRWGGLGAKRLGLVGTVGREAFGALCDNLHPETGHQLTVRTRSDRRVGYDINFHAPKSLSVLHAQTGDEALMDAFRRSVDDTMREMEREMKTRVRGKGRNADRATGNMVWAEFVHLTARPVDGVPDPHLHAHCFAMNATWDETEGRWKAGQFGDLKRDAPYYEAAFHARLSSRLRELGYPIERTARGWEVGGLSRGLLEKFSQRTARIEEAAKEKGITSDREKDRLGAATRETKRKGLTLDLLKGLWDARLTPEERKAIRAARDARGGIVPPVTNAAEAMAWAEGHCFERASAVPESRLLTEALWRGMGSVTAADLRRELPRRNLISAGKNGQVYCTTREVLGEERAMVAFVRDGRSSCRPLNAGHAPAEGLLSEEQRAAVRHVLTSTDRVIGLRGGAGTGKTTLMQEAVAGIRAGGKQVFAFAPSAEASRKVLRSEGFGDADTVARLLADRELQGKIRDQVVWIDEAGLLGAKTLRQVFDLAGRQNARVVLAGDIRQHHAVERGDALRLLEEAGVLESASVKAIRRQRGSYREAVAALQDGRPLEALERLDAMGAVREADEAGRHGMLVADYVAAAKAGKSVLVVSPTHAEGDRATGLVRERLRAEGMLDADERTLPVLRGLGWTEAQRADPGHYREGLVLQFQQNAKGFRKGDRLRVEGTDGDSLRCRNAKGAEIALPCAMACRWQVFEEGERPFAKGDRVRITQNGKSLDGRHRIHNGALHEIAGFTREGNLRLENGWVLPKDYGHLTHGYVSTSHAAQGKTVDRVLVAQGTESLPASSLEQFYVSASRGRESVTIYTDSREDLLRAVSASSQRYSASDLVAAEEPRPEPVSPQREQALLVNRLLARASAWAGRQVRSLAERVREHAPNPLIAKYATAGLSVPGHVPDRGHAADLLRRYGRTPPPKDFDRLKERGRDRD